MTRRAAMPHGRAGAAPGPAAEPPDGPPDGLPDGRPPDAAASLPMDIQKLGTQKLGNLHAGALQLGPLRPKVKSPHVKDLCWVGGGTHPGSGLLTIIESANIASNYISQRLGKGPLAHWPEVPAPGSLPVSDAPPLRRAG